MKILEAEKVSFLANGKKILEDVSLEVELGESVTIIGPNGAGKTTLLRAIVGLLNSRHLQGEISINKKSVRRLSRRDIGCQISYVPQRPILPSHMKLLDYVLLGRTPHISAFSMENRGDIEIAMDALSQTGMAWAKERRMHTLSGGEAQLGAIARALATQAPLMLLDEPTSSLDLGHRISLWNFIQQLPAQNNIAVISTMHDLQLASYGCGRLILLADGKICDEGLPAQVLTSENLLQYYGVDAEVVPQNKGMGILPRYGA